MRKLLLLIVIIFTGCNKQGEIHIDGGTYKICTIDSCEYILIKYDSQDYELVHKGNCKFCIKRHKQELDNQESHYKE